jgi:hypothetical protein
VIPGGSGPGDSDPGTDVEPFDPTPLEPFDPTPLEPGDPSEPAPATPRSRFTKGAAFALGTCLEAGELTLFFDVFIPAEGENPAVVLFDAVTGEPLQKIHPGALELIEVVLDPSDAAPPPGKRTVRVKVTAIVPPGGGPICPVTSLLGIQVSFDAPDTLSPPPAGPQPKVPF